MHKPGNSYLGTTKLVEACWSRSHEYCELLDFGHQNALKIKAVVSFLTEKV
jgi:hypothetical protein